MDTWTPRIIRGNNRGKSFPKRGFTPYTLDRPPKKCKAGRKINQIILLRWTVFADCSQRNESMADQIQLSRKGKADFSGTIPDRITGKKHGNASRQPERTLSTTSTLPKSGNLKKRPVKTALRPVPLNDTSRTGQMERKYGQEHLASNEAQSFSADRFKACPSGVRPGTAGAFAGN